YLKSAAAIPISLRIPLTHHEHSVETTRAFFAHLLPEGAVLQELARRHDVDELDLVALLSFAGAECAGALSIVPQGAPQPKRPGRVPEDYRPLSDDELERDLRELEAGRLISHRDLQDISLAGVQAKTALFINASGGCFVPVPSAPTTHIIKVAHREMDYG